jgi:hypothetical protein
LHLPRRSDTPLKCVGALAAVDGLGDGLVEVEGPGQRRPVAGGQVDPTDVAGGGQFGRLRDSRAIHSCSWAQGKLQEMTVTGTS